MDRGQTGAWSLNSARAVGLALGRRCLDHTGGAPLAFLLLACAPLLRAAAPLVVIVNAASGVTAMSREEASSLFMGRQKRLASGLVALPVEPMDDPEVRSRFYQLLVNAPLPQIRAYWARMYFSGQAQPPHQARNAQEVLEVVLANKGAIGFLEQPRLDRRVKVVLVLQEPAEP